MEKNCPERKLRTNEKKNIKTTYVCINCKNTKTWHSTATMIVCVCMNSLFKTIKIMCWFQHERITVLFFFCFMARENKKNYEWLCRPESTETNIDLSCHGTNKPHEKERERKKNPFHMECMSNDCHGISAETTFAISSSLHFWII